LIKKSFDFLVVNIDRITESSQQIEEIDVALADQSDRFD